MTNIIVNFSSRKNHVLFGPWGYQNDLFCKKIVLFYYKKGLVKWVKHAVIYIVWSKEVK